MVVCLSSPSSLETRMLSFTSAHSLSNRTIPIRYSNPCPKFSPRASLSTSFVAPFVGGSASGDLTGQNLRVPSLMPSPSGRCGKRGVVTKIPFSRGSPLRPPPPDLASHLFDQQIVYVGLPLYPPVVEMILQQFVYLQRMGVKEKIYLYLNSTGTAQDKGQLYYDADAFLLYDNMRCIQAPISTVCIGNCWREACLLLAAGDKGNRFALPSSSIMMMEPIARVQGQATDIEATREEIKRMKTIMVNLLSEHVGKTPEQIAEDIRRPKYFSPSEAVEYGIIDKVLNNEKDRVDHNIISSLNSGL